MDEVEHRIGRITEGAAHTHDWLERAVDAICTRCGLVLELPPREG